MKSHCEEFTLWTLCMDAVSEKVLRELQLPNVKVISIRDVETAFPNLLNIKHQRSNVEYYFTSTPFLPLYIFSQHQQVELVTYLDADLFFYSNPEPLFAELGEKSIAIIEHKFSKGLETMVTHGIYNVGWVTFRNDKNGIECLQWWRDRCLECCFDHYEDGKFADQKYLDVWPEIFPGVVVLQHRGANVAPWNVANYKITFQSSHVFIDSDLLIFYHFHGVRRLFKNFYDSALGLYNTRLDSGLRRNVYSPYITVLNQTYVLINTKTSSLKTVRVPQSGAVSQRIFINAKWLYYFIMKVILRRNYLFIR